MNFAEPIQVAVDLPAKLLPAIADVLRRRTGAVWQLLPDRLNWIPNDAPARLSVAGGPLWQGQLGLPRAASASAEHFAGTPAGTDLQVCFPESSPWTSHDADPYCHTAFHSRADTGAGRSEAWDESCQARPLADLVIQGACYPGMPPLR